MVLTQKTEKRGRFKFIYVDDSADDFLRVNSQFVYTGTYEIEYQDPNLFKTLTSNGSASKGNRSNEDDNISEVTPNDTDEDRAMFALYIPSTEKNEDLDSLLPAEFYAQAQKKEEEDKRKEKLRREKRKEAVDMLRKESSMIPMAQSPKKKAKVIKEVENLEIGTCKKVCQYLTIL